MNRELEALAERCEKAAGPDREFDAEIAQAIGVGPTGFAQAKGKHWVTWPAYTSSLDAALELVPEGLGWTLYSDGYAGVGPITDDEIPQPEIIAATPALALCAAALRARAASRKDQG